jgi:hypothetical protein
MGGDHAVMRWFYQEPGLRPVGLAKAGAEA